jgi:hypothetical protein
MKNPLLNYHSNESNNKHVIKSISRLFIILNLNPIPIDVRIYSLEIEESVFNELIKNYILVETSAKLLKKFNFLISIASIGKDVLEKVNLLKYDLDDINMVIFYPHFLYNEFKIYLSIYEKKTIDDLYNILLINDHIKDKKDNNIQNNYTQFIISLGKDLNKICNLSKNYKFMNRNFFENNNYHDNGYLSFIKNKENVVIFNNINFIKLKKQINFILSKLNYENKYLLISYLLLSKDYCHGVINNIYLLRKYKFIFNNYIHLFRYIIGFTWSQLYIEEMNKKKNMTKDDIFIFDIETVGNLLSFPISTNCPEFNPYNCIMINNKSLKTNIYSLNYYNISYDKFTAFPINNNNNICNLQQFKAHLNIFATSNPSNNLFQNINFEKEDIAITGSAVCACISNFHPLMSLFHNYVNEVSIKNRYFDEYYANADIDVMIKTTDFFEFINRVKRIYAQIKKNVVTIYKPHALPEHVNLVCEKVVYYFLYEEEIIEIIKDSKYNLNEIIQNIDTDYVQDIFRSSFEKEYIKYKEEQQGKIIDPEFLKNNPEYLELDNLPFKIRKVKHFKDIVMDKIRISFKYKIKSPHLKHNIELFNVTTSDFFGVVQTFHLPCVRAYYNYSNVYMTTSCVSAHLTRMNLDYKYFAGTCHPAEIINKYRMRGFGIYLNIKEQETLYVYSKNNSFWNNLYNLDNICKNSFFNALNFNHKLFFPRLYNSDFFDKCYPVDLDKGYDDGFMNYKKIILSKNDILEIINTKSVINKNNIDILSYINKLTICDSTGYMKSPKTWLIETFIV